jgi:hypothetical protein
MIHNSVGIFPWGSWRENEGSIRGERNLVFLFCFACHSSSFCPTSELQIFPSICACRNLPEPSVGTYADECRIDSTRHDQPIQQTYKLLYRTTARTAIVLSVFLIETRTYTTKNWWVEGASLERTRCNTLLGLRTRPIEGIYCRWMAYRVTPL